MSIFLPESFLKAFFYPTFVFMHLERHLEAVLKKNRIPILLVCYSEAMFRGTLEFIVMSNTGMVTNAVKKKTSEVRLKTSLMMAFLC